LNFLGIDYGRKRIGLSFADGELGVAVPLNPLLNLQGPDLFQAIGEVLQERRVGELVIGYPLHMDGREGQRTQEVDEFVNALRNRFGLPIHKVDERLSTARVEADFREFGKKPARKSGEVDSGAATLILQDYLEQRGLEGACLPEHDPEDWQDG
jgi:putative Holliday junction resolvase